MHPPGEYANVADMRIVYISPFNDDIFSLPYFDSIILPGMCGSSAFQKSGKGVGYEY